MKRFEDFNWEFDEDDEDNELDIGDNVKFKYSSDEIPEYFTDEDDIPDELIIHGNVKLHKDYDAKIVAIHYNYYIVKYLGDNSRYVQLGFLEKDLVKI